MIEGAVIKPMKQSNIVPLSDRAREIILGSVLGDGSIKIHQGYANARFSIRHSMIQKEYFYWKASQLKEISSDRSVFVQKNDRGFSENPKLRYQSQALEQLTEIYRLTHKRNKLNVSRRWLNRLSPLSLAIWWFDDGSIIANGRKGVICTDGFDQKEVKALARYLAVVWQVKTAVASVKKPRGGKQDGYYRLWFRSTEELKKFLRIIIPFTPVEGLLPKILLLYHDDQLQQRWISEIKTATGFSADIIKKYLEEKKKRWKRFQKMI